MLVSATSCSHLRERPAEVANFEWVSPPRPHKVIAPKGVKYHVVVKSTAEEKLAENPALICLSWDSYLEMSKFNQETLRYIKGSNALINYYEEVLKNEPPTP
jgi:hypothetical protein